jgi:hypothetical protein
VLKLGFTQKPLPDLWFSVDGVALPAQACGRALTRHKHHVAIPAFAQVNPGQHVVEIARNARHDFPVTNDLRSRST